MIIALCKFHRDNRGAKGAHSKGEKGNSDCCQFDKLDHPSRGYSIHDVNGLTECLLLKTYAIPSSDQSSRPSGQAATQENEKGKVVLV